jgi:hypothetical protein
MWRHSVTEENVVYQNTIDNNTWEMKVVRVTDYQGELSVTRVADGEVVHTAIVGLAYGAIFGPDAADVADWQDAALKVIDAQPGRHD